MSISESSQWCPVVLTLLLAGLKPPQRHEEPPGEEDSLDGLDDLHGLQLPVVDGGEDVAWPEPRPGHWTVRADTGDEDLQREIILRPGVKQKSGQVR